MTRYSEALKRPRPDGAEVGPYPEGFSDFLDMKVLGRKRVERFGNPFGANANALGFSDRKELVRNLCVRVDPVRLAELDALTEVLDCNKQEFVLELLVAGMEQAKELLTRQGLGPVYEQELDRRIEAAGFTVEPSPNEGYWTLHYKGEPISNARYKEHAEAATAMKTLIGRELGGAGD